PPQLSTRVPYATLFRSIEQEGILLMVAEVHCRFRAPAHYDEEVMVRTTIREADPRMVRFDYDLLGEDRRSLAVGYTKHVFCGPEDRKSTRLNSSHVKIS